VKYEGRVRIYNPFSLSWPNMSLINPRYRYEIRTQSAVAEEHFFCSKISKIHFFQVSIGFPLGNYHTVSIKQKNSQNYLYILASHMA